MTEYLTSFNSIIRIIRPKIISALGISSDRVLNAASLTGPDLLNILGNETKAALVDDDFIVFELLENDSADYNGTSQELDDSMTTVQAFNFNLKFYGNNSHDLAIKLMMYFKGYDIAVGLQQEGVFVSGMTAPRCVNEFINNIVWPRCDITLQLYVRFNYGITASDGYADNTYSDNINRLNITRY